HPSAVATSAPTPIALTPCVSATRAASRAARAPSRPTSTRCTPSSASPSPMASPMPTVPPVMTAILPPSPRSIVFSLSGDPDLQLHIVRPRLDGALERLDRIRKAESLGDQRLEIHLARGDQRDGAFILMRVAKNVLDA